MQPVVVSTADNPVQGFCNTAFIELHDLQAIHIILKGSVLFQLLMKYPS